MDEWMDDDENECTNGWMHKRMNENDRMASSTVGEMDGWMVKWMDGWMVKMNGWMVKMNG